MNDDPDLGPYAARLERIRSAEQARRGALAREETRRQQHEAAVRCYVDERMPAEPMGDAERESLARTLETTARRLLVDQAGESDQSLEVWRAEGFTLGEFRRERERRLRRLLLERELGKRLRDLERTGRGLHDPWGRYVEVVEATLSDQRLQQLLDTSTESLQTLRADAEACAVDNDAPRIRAYARAAPPILAGRRPARASAPEPRSDREDPGPSGDEADAAPRVEAAAKRRTAKRPFTIRGLDPDATRERLRDVLKLAERSGFSSKQIGDRYDAPSQTVRTWRAEARKMRDRGEL